MRPLLRSMQWSLHMSLLLLAHSTGLWVLSVIRPNPRLDVFLVPWVWVHGLRFPPRLCGDSVVLLPSGLWQQVRQGLWQKAHRKLTRIWGFALLMVVLRGISYISMMWLGKVGPSELHRHRMSLVRVIGRGGRSLMTWLIFLGPLGFCLLYPPWILQTRMSLRHYEIFSPSLTSASEFPQPYCKTPFVHSRASLRRIYIRPQLRLISLPWVQGLHLQMILICVFSSLLLRLVVPYRLMLVSSPAKSVGTPPWVEVILLKVCSFQMRTWFMLGKSAADDASRIGS